VFKRVKAISDVKFVLQIFYGFFIQEINPGMNFAAHGFNIETPVKKKYVRMNFQNRIGHNFFIQRHGVGAADIARRNIFSVDFELIKNVFAIFDGRQSHGILFVKNFLLCRATDILKETLAAYLSILI
jgi:hypothetical protein